MGRVWPSPDTDSNRFGAPASAVAVKHSAYPHRVPRPMEMGPGFTTPGTLALIAYVPVHGPSLSLKGEAAIPVASVRLVPLTNGMPANVSPPISHKTATLSAGVSPRRTRTRKGSASVA